MEIEKRIQSLLEENGMEVAEDGTIFGEVDSFGYLSAIISLEEEFSIEFPDEYLNVELISLEHFSEIVKTLTHQSNE